MDTIKWPRRVKSAVEGVKTMKRPRRVKSLCLDKDEDGMQLDDHLEKIHDNLYLSVANFCGGYLIHIRKHYLKDGCLKPKTEGCAFSVEVCHISGYPTWHWRTMLGDGKRYASRGIRKLCWTVACHRWHVCKHWYLEVLFQSTQGRNRRFEQGHWACSDRSIDNSSIFWLAIRRWCLPNRVTRRFIRPWEDVIFVDRLTNTRTKTMMMVQASFLA